MKILILNWRDIKHPFSGGAEVMLYNHAKYWHKNGAEIIWFSASFQNARNQETIDGITYIRRGSKYTVHLYAIVFFLFQKFKNPDLVIDCFHGIPFFFPIVVFKKKIIVIIHEVAGVVWFANFPFPIAIFGYFLERLSFLLYRNIPFITVSDSTKNDLLKQGIHSEFIHVIHNGLTIHHKKDSIKKELVPTFLFLGRISKDKGITDALETFKIVKDAYPDAQLWIVGKEEKDGFLNSLLKKFPLRKDISFFGFVNEEKKIELIARATILIHPSKKEGWGLTVIEAASQGTPTVGYNVEGLRDSIIQGKTGILVNKFPQDLAREVIKLLQNKVLYKNMSQEAIKWSKEFTWEKSVQESWKLIQKRRNQL